MAEFQTVTKTSDVPPGQMKVVNLGGEEIAIANVDGIYFAFGNFCPHEGGPLGEGELEGTAVTCPWHFTVFDVTTRRYRKRSTSVERQLLRFLLPEAKFVPAAP